MTSGSQRLCQDPCSRYRGAVRRGATGATVWASHPTRDRLPAVRRSSLTGAPFRCGLFKPPSSVQPSRCSFFATVFLDAAFLAFLATFTCSPFRRARLLFAALFLATARLAFACDASSLSPSSCHVSHLSVNPSCESSPEKSAVISRACWSRGWDVLCLRDAE